ncbi:hypothetical protein [Neobacillus cucumis]|uniref:hypothetical protein n=1 Tax=Neobacillus cucumis TaxID=1740721 RepID=UPI0019627543|nr:hypothetical protein [Neobacillus cucumis]MBM7653974.1 putative membrane protein [Neobacillus cucumis]MDR4950082.1 hypothetical protein [Neobacillus cucumis]
MKVNRIIIILIIFAWPLYELYQLQLGAVSFFLLAILFLYISIKEFKKIKKEKSSNDKPSPPQKIK